MCESANAERNLVGVGEGIEDRRRCKLLQKVLGRLPESHERNVIGGLLFDRIMLCHDGTEQGRKALKQGAELAKQLGSEVHVLAVISESAANASTAAAAAGHVCLIDYEDKYQAMLDESLRKLAARGIAAYAHLARGETIEEIRKKSVELSIDLIVVGQYPNSQGRRWWSGVERRSLAESVQCAVLIAVDTEYS